jgi:hypothetical protein
VFLYAFDLIELNGEDLRREPFETRKATLASLLKRAAPGLRLNEHIEADGPTVFAHACRASRASSRSGRTRPTAAAGRKTGSRAKTRRVRRCGARRRRIGGALYLPPEMFYCSCRLLPNNTQATCGSSSRTSPVVGKLAKPVPDIVGHSENVRHLVHGEHGLDQQHVLPEQVLLRAASCRIVAKRIEELPVRHHPS